jgi:hypothetical protein
MARAANHSSRVIVIGVLGACLGDALYRWWRHGSVDWIGVLCVGIGWAMAAALFEVLSRRRMQRQDLNTTEGRV